MSASTVLFDMDGLILDTEKICLDCFVETGLEFGIDDITSVFIDSIGLRHRQSKIIIESGLAGRIDIDTFSQCWNLKIRHSLNSHIPVKPGARELLEQLKANNVRAAIATSTRTEAASKQLEKVGLADFFEHIVGGDQVVKGKPEPEIYFKAAAMLDRQANDCIVFEDSDPGVLAAIRSGAQTVQIPDLKAPSPETIKLGHTIAPTLLDGAKSVGLI